MHKTYKTTSSEQAKAIDALLNQWSKNINNPSLYFYRHVVEISNKLVSPIRLIDESSFDQYNVESNNIGYWALIVVSSEWHGKTISGYIQALVDLNIINEDISKVAIVFCEVLSERKEFWNAQCIDIVNDKGIDILLSPTHDILKEHYDYSTAFDVMYVDTDNPNNTIISDKMFFETLKRYFVFDISTVMSGHYTSKLTIENYFDLLDIEPFSFSCSELAGDGEMATVLYKPEPNSHQEEILSKMILAYKKMHAWDDLLEHYSFTADFDLKDKNKNATLKHIGELMGVSEYIPNQLESLSYRKELFISTLDIFDLSFILNEEIRPDKDKIPADELLKLFNDNDIDIYSLMLWALFAEGAAEEMYDFSQVDPPGYYDYKDIKHNGDVHLPKKCVISLLNADLCLPRLTDRGEEIAYLAAMLNNAGQDNDCLIEIRLPNFSMAEIDELVLSGFKYKLSRFGDVIYDETGLFDYRNVFENSVDDKGTHIEINQNAVFQPGHKQILIGYNTCQYIRNTLTTALSKKDNGRLNKYRRNILPIDKSNSAQVEQLSRLAKMFLFDDSVAKEIENTSMCSSISINTDDMFKTLTVQHDQLIEEDWIDNISLIADMTRIWTDRLSDVGIKFSMPAKDLDLKHLKRLWDVGYFLGIHHDMHSLEKSIPVDDIIG